MRPAGQVLETNRGRDPGGDRQPTCAVRVQCAGEDANAVGKDLTPLRDCCSKPVSRSSNGPSASTTRAKRRTSSSARRRRRARRTYRAGQSGDHLLQPQAEPDTNPVSLDKLATSDIRLRRRHRPPPPRSRSPRRGRSAVGPLPIEGGSQRSAFAPACGSPQVASQFASRAVAALGQHDSGWNCTPSTGRSRCRSAITTRRPSSRDLELGRQRILADSEGGVAGRDERIRTPMQDSGVLVMPSLSCRATTPARARPRRRRRRQSPGAPGRHRARGRTRPAR